MYNDKQVRTVVGEDGEPRFVAADVCGVLELQNVTEALRGLEEDEKSIFRIADSAGREFPTVILTEPGLYSLVTRSRKPEAKAFKRWVTHEAIPHHPQTHDERKKKEARQMNSALQVFNYEGRDVRTVVGDDGEPWVVAKDVCLGLGYSESSSVAQLAASVPDEWKGIKRIDTPGGRQEMLCLSEQGLYFFLARSDKPAALPFQKWIAGDVLPAIRKHGGYLTPAKIEEALLNPDTIIRLATDLKAERERRIALEAQVEADAPKVEFYDAVTVADGDISVGQMAKLICQNGFEIGRTEFFAWLREAGYLCKGAGKDWNMPTQRSMVAGWFRVVERNIEHRNGWKLATTTRVTPRGQQYFIRLFMRAQRELSSAAERFRRTRPAA